LNEGATDAAGAAGDDRWLPFRVYEVGKIRSTSGDVRRQAAQGLECGNGYAGERNHHAVSGLFVPQTGDHDRKSRGVPVEADRRADMGAAWRT